MNLVPNRELATLTETITKLYTNATKTTCDLTSSSLIGLKNDTTRKFEKTACQAGRPHFYRDTPHHDARCSGYRHAKPPLGQQCRGRRGSQPDYHAHFPCVRGHQSRDVRSMFPVYRCKAA